MAAFGYRQPLQMFPTAVMATAPPAPPAGPHAMAPTAGNWLKIYREKKEREFVPTIWEK